MNKNQIKLSDGRIVTSYDPSIREFLDAVDMSDSVSQIGIVSLSAVIKVDGKKITVENWRNNFTAIDVMEIQMAFTPDEYKKEKLPLKLSNGKMCTLGNPLIGEVMDRMYGDDAIAKYQQANIISAMLVIDDKKVSISEFLDKYKWSDFQRITTSMQMPKNL